jgi:hypothetical protein
MIFQIIHLFKFDIGNSIAKLAISNNQTNYGGRIIVRKKNGRNYKSMLKQLYFLVAAFRFKIKT